jgi:outer membrane murein-binding lipoprotein Lpp
LLGGQAKELLGKLAPHLFKEAQPQDDFIEAQAAFKKVSSDFRQMADKKNKLEQKVANLFSQFEAAKVELAGVAEKLGKTETEHTLLYNKFTEVANRTGQALKPKLEPREQDGGREEEDDLLDTCMEPPVASADAEAAKTEATAEAAKQTAQQEAELQDLRQQELAAQAALAAVVQQGQEHLLEGWQEIVSKRRTLESAAAAKAEAALSGSIGIPLSAEQAREAAECLGKLLAPSHSRAARAAAAAPYRTNRG